MFKWASYLHISCELTGALVHYDLIHICEIYLRWRFRRLITIMITVRTIRRYIT